LPLPRSFLSAASSLPQRATRSHRSGIFGTSQLLGNVNGGSNYIYCYIESKM
jgi:hypothetical protein